MDNILLNRIIVMLMQCNSGFCFGRSGFTTSKIEIEKNEKSSQNSTFPKVGIPVLSMSEQ